MKAIAYRQAGPTTVKDALVEVVEDTPVPGPRDLLVEVRAVSVNPVDVKVRARMSPEEGAHRVLGFDAAGTVKAVGADVTAFKPGDDVFYAGDLTRPGTNAEFHLVDERIVGPKPSSLDFLNAAAMPLTSITAWEMLFDSFGLTEGAGTGDAILVIGGAGGVGSVLIQLAKQLTGLKVVATASRPETRAWVEQMGADHVVDHRQPLEAQMKAIGVSPRYVAALTHTDKHFEQIVALIKPRGHIAVIDDPGTLDIVPLKPKALSVSWEFMFARPMFQTDDMDAQQRLLRRVSEMLDAGLLKSTMRAHLGALSAAQLQAAHEQQDSGKTIGKIVLGGFEA
ncbi:MAG: zinc-binding alcohol dehydrogenase family protein [Myxococcota bacterium]